MRLLKHKHLLAALLFCLVLGMGTVCYADEVAATVTVESAKIRASADPNSTQLGSAKQGGTVSIIGQTTGTDGNTWYQVYVDADTKGFIRADLVSVTGTGTISTLTDTTTTTSTDTTTTTTTTTDTTSVTATESRTGWVANTTKGVNIRKGASTSTDKVATVNKDMSLTITGEATGDDGKTWYQVSFTYSGKEITGFIRSDFITFTQPTATSTITGTTETTETEATTETATEAATEAATEEQPQETETTTTDDTSNIILLNTDETPYILPGFTQIILKWEEQDITAYKNGDFYLFYAQKQNGEEGWYLFDSNNNVYQRYVYTSEGATVPDDSEGSIGMVPLIIFGVIVVILIAVIIFMFMKLREYTIEYEYEEDEEEDDEEEYEEEVEEEPVKKQPKPQPQQRPTQGAQQTKRPQQTSENGQSAKRPQQGSSQPQQRSGNSASKQQASGQPRKQQTSSAQQRPTQSKTQQQGRKAKNFLEAEDDDMDFIDI